MLGTALPAQCWGVYDHQNPIQGDCCYFFATFMGPLYWALHWKMKGGNQRQPEEDDEFSTVHGYHQEGICSMKGMHWGTINWSCFLITWTEGMPTHGPHCMPAYWSYQRPGNEMYYMQIHKSQGWDLLVQEETQVHKMWTLLPWSKDCQRGKRKWDNTSDNGWKERKDSRNERVNTMQEVDPQEDEPGQNIVFSAQYNGDNPSDDPNVITTYDSESGETLSWYNWLADSAATSYVTNQQNAFKTCQTFKNGKGEVCGVGNIAPKAEGQGTIELESEIDGKTYTITLKDVLYIPNMQNSLISLGQWDKRGGWWQCQNGTLSIITKDEQTVAKGHCLRNLNLYWMCVKVHSPKVDQVNEMHKIILPWEVWHHRWFQHWSKLTQTQLSILHRMQVSQETFHFDLWRKCHVTSLHGNQYFMMIVDDNSLLWNSPSAPYLISLILSTMPLSSLLNKLSILFHSIIVWPCRWYYKVQGWAHV